MYHAFVGYQDGCSTSSGCCSGAHHTGRKPRCVLGSDVCALLVHALTRHLRHGSTGLGQITKDTLNPLLLQVSLRADSAAPRRDLARASSGVLFYQSFFHFSVCWGVLLRPAPVATQVHSTPHAWHAG